MFTVKVKKAAVGLDGKPIAGKFLTKLVQAKEVAVNVLRPGELYEVAGGEPGNSFAFYVGDRRKRPEAFASNIDLWDVAYIENSEGKTTETVRAGS